MPREVVVLGNGPSLRGFDYSSLEGRFVIACNRIHLVYPTTSWRPTAYVSIDANGNHDNIVGDVRLHVAEGYPCHLSHSIVWTALHPYEKPQPERCYPWHRYKNVIVRFRCAHSWGGTLAPEGWHLPHLCTYGGSLFTALQIAILEYGARSLVVLGAEGIYLPGDKNHCFDNYLTSNEDYSQEAADRKTEEHGVAREMAIAGCRDLGVSVAWDV